MRAFFACCFWGGIGTALSQNMGGVWPKDWKRWVWGGDVNIGGLCWRLYVILRYCAKKWVGYVCGGSKIELWNGLQGQLTNSGQVFVPEDDG